MKISELFQKDIARAIEGVIKADDDRHLEIELEEYVATHDVVRGLGRFTDRYLDERAANGVWISGFFGSGKSHLLKILSLILDQRPLPNGTRPADIILPKIEDELLRTALRKAVSVPAQSVLFNIDQKFDGIGGDHTAPILEVFVKVLNELQGYYGNQGYIAEFEYHLAQRNELEGFKATYLEVIGRNWEKDREAIATATKAAFAKAYAQHFKVPESEAARVMQEVRADYKMSIETFARRVRQYIDSKGPTFRLNFFVDEIGQFIGQDSTRMLNLQTMAETLSTVCDGRAWVFVTSQADLEVILGDFKNMAAQDITKIKGRFKTQMTLASADVQEVIQKRLLAKREAEPEILTRIYDREKENLGTLFRFTDGSVQLRTWRGSNEFCGLYPFNPYQLSLFQTAIMALSRHDAFTGRYMSVGERSMLAVFQDVAKAIRQEEVGSLATFDQMYDGLAPSLRGDVQTSIKLAELQLEPMPLRILKALFLLKWVREFKATPRNIGILLIDAPNVDIRAHEKSVADGLAVLEGQSYLQRNGDVFEFLTDSEKDVEKEIKATGIDDSQVTAELGKVLFTDILRDPKIRYEGNGQDYAYVRRIDDAPVGRADGDVGINVITTENPNYAHSAILAMQNTGKQEIMAVLPADDGLVAEVRLYLKTQKYIQQNSGGNDPTRNSILEQRGRQNTMRRTEIALLAGDLLSRAPVYLNGRTLENLGQSEPRVRFAKAGQELISFAYPNLKMLKGSHDDAGLSKTLLDPDDLLTSAAQTLSEAENEVFIHVSRNRDNGERTTVEEIVKHFGRRPYGWVPIATLTLVARLFRMGRVELRTTELLTAREALEHLRNSRNHGDVRVALQEQFDSTKVSALKRFHQEFFDKPNTGTDARSVSQQVQQAMATEAMVLDGLCAQSNAYPFLAVLKPVAEKLHRLSLRDYTYLLNQLVDFKDDLLAAKDESIAPIKAFMNGQQKTAYDEAMGFLRAEDANLAEVDPAEVRPIRDLAAAAAPYNGNAVPAAKAAVARVRTLLTDLLKAERDAAVAKVAEYKARIEATAEFPKLDGEKQAKVLALTEQTQRSIAGAKVLMGIRDLVRVYVERHYPEQLSLACHLATPPETSPTPVKGSAGESGGAGAGAQRPPRVLHIRLNQLKVGFTSPTITTVPELDLYLAALRAAIQSELEKGNRVTL